MKQYSFKKGMEKGFLSILIMCSSIAAFAGFSEINLWEILENYLKPVLGSLTVGTVLAMVINYLKVKNALD